MTGEGFQSVMAGLGRQAPGPLTPATGDRDAELRYLRAQNGLLEQTNRALSGEVASLRARLLQAESEGEALSKEVDGQREAMRKLRTTIKVQSDQIAQSSSPSLAGDTEGRRPNVYGQPPPVYNPRQRSITPAHPVDPPPSMVRQQSAPTPSRATTTSFQTPSSRALMPLRSTQPPSLPHHQLIHLRDLQDIEPSTELASQFTRIFRMTETWARKYMNAPDATRDSQMPDEMRMSMQSQMTTETATKLISSDSTRYFAIARLMNYQINLIAFRPLIVRGYKKFYDDKIAELRSQLHHVMPIHVRRAVVVASNEVINDMRKEPAFEVYLDQLVTRQVHEMWKFLEAMFAPGAARHEAWIDLGDIWTAAAKLGIAMLLKPSGFRLDFPSVGPHILFNPAQMLNRDPNYTQAPTTLSQMGARVRLGITPVVAETNYMQSDLSPKVLHLANVLLEV